MQALNPRLEPLKSQTELIKMISAAVQGMAESRKELQELKEQSPDAVQRILDKARV